MNTGQVMLGIAALGMLTFVILNSNKTSTSTLDAMTYNKGVIAANSLALSLFDEISSKAFDEKIVNGNTITSANDFSINLQAESGETYPNFDDIDDYNNFKETKIIPQIGKFNIYVKVTYIRDNLVKTSVQTYNKNVTIVVKGNSFENQTTGQKDSLVISGVLSQWRML